MAILAKYRGGRNLRNEGWVSRGIEEICGLTRRARSDTSWGVGLELTWLSPHGDETVTGLVLRLRLFLFFWPAAHIFLTVRGQRVPERSFSP